MQAASAGLFPAPIIQPLTKKVMEEKNIRLDDQHPKGLDAVDPASFDLIVNMSGHKLPVKGPMEIMDWKVQDPIGEPEEVYVSVRDQIEMGVMRLILEFRRRANPAPERMPTVLAGRRLAEKHERCFARGETRGQK